MYNIYDDTQFFARLELLRRYFGLSGYDAVIQMAVYGFYSKLEEEIRCADLDVK